MLIRLALFWISIVLVNACSREGTNKTVPKLWDASAYFKTEIIRLTKLQLHLKKELMFNQKISNIELDNINWEKELAEFEKLDLNGIQNKGNYTVDSLLSNDSCFVSYRTTLDKLNIQELTVAYSLNAPQYLVMMAVLHVNTNLYQSRKILRYHPLVGYSIEGTQEVQLGKNIAFAVKNTFVYASVNQ